VCTGTETCDLGTYTCQSGTHLGEGTQCGATANDVCVGDECQNVQCTTDEECDDGNECTVASSCNDYTCSPTTNAPNGEPCGTDQVCVDGLCGGNCVSDADCTDGNVCNGTETCNPTTFTCETSAAPGDGTQCGATALDVCIGESCETVQCVSDTYCDDGNVCTGEETCDLGSYTCQSGTAPGDGTQCGATELDICIGETCQPVTCLDDSYCVDDGNPCTGAPTCDGYACEAGVNVEDGTSCGTDAVCVGGTCQAGCTTDEQCDDGNVCTGVESCNLDTFTCQNGAAPGDGTQCGDNANDVCLGDTCMYDVACLVDTDCPDDGNICNGDQTCSASFTCQAGTNLPNGTSCGDDLVCFNGACREGCTIDADCDDGLLCNGVETCDSITNQCQAGTGPGDGTQCGGDTDVCINEVCESVQCVTDGHCPDDGNVCTGAPSCGGDYTCQTGANVDNGTVCGAGDVCFDGTCREGCTTDAECDDGLVCNGTETCDLGTFTCQSGTAPGDGTQCGATALDICLGDVCDTVECTEDMHCPDDGNVCTGAPSCGGDYTCQAGANEPNGSVCGSELVCFDGTCREGCTTDAECDDGLVCNGAETCDPGTFTCQAGTPLANGTVCGSETDVCVNQICVPDSCTSNGQCSDGNVCTGTETCNFTSYQCEVGAAPGDGTQCGATALDVCIGESCENVECVSDTYCDDDNVCTGVETCDLGSYTCQSGTAPGDGTQCGPTSSDVCVGDTCVTGVECTDVGESGQCSDGNACNGVEVCGADFTCQPGTNLADGTSCGTDLVCIAGACEPGCTTDAECDDGNPCTGTGTCNPGTFQCETSAAPGDGAQCGATALDVCVGTTCQNVECVDNSYCPNDGDPCNGEESCNLGTFQCQSTGALGEGEQCGGDPLWICKSSECTEVECTMSSHCNDGNFCNGTETCNFATNMCQDGTSPEPGSSCGGGNLCNAYEQCVTPTCTTDAFCNDGNICNGTETCDLSIYECQDGTPPGEGTQCGGETDICLGGVCENVECTLDAHCVDGNICNGTETCSGSYECQAGTQAPDGTACDGGGSCEAGECVAPRYCTATYSLVPRMIIEGTAFGAGDGTYTLPAGSLILHYEANADNDGPLSGGAVDVRYWWISNDFQTTTAGVTVNTKVNAYTPRCNGEEEPEPLYPAPSVCLDDGNLTPMATGTWSANSVSWATCNAHPDWNSSSISAYTPDDESTGPGCLNNYRSRGNVHCSESSWSLGNCSDGALVLGDNPQNSMHNQPLNALALSADGASVSLPKTNVPNTNPSRTYIDFTGTRSSVTCN
jgi:hypothetical protein